MKYLSIEKMNRYLEWKKSAIAFAFMTSVMLSAGIEAGVEPGVYFYDSSFNGVTINNYATGNEMPSGLDRQVSQLGFIRPVCVFLWHTTDFVGTPHIVRYPEPLDFVQLPNKYWSSYHVTQSIHRADCNYPRQNQHEVRFYEGETNYFQNHDWVMKMYPGMRTMKLKERNDGISSIYISKGVKVTAYSNAYTSYASDTERYVFSGCSGATSFDRLRTVGWKGWNNRISSIEVQKCDPQDEIDAGIGVMVWEHRNLGGNSERLPGGELAFIGNDKNDRISSFVVPRGVSFEIFEDRNFNRDGPYGDTGAGVRIFGSCSKTVSESDLSQVRYYGNNKKINDSISSYRVRKMNCPG